MIGDRKAKRRKRKAVEKEAWQLGIEWLESLYQPSANGTPAKLDGILYEYDGSFQSYTNYKQLEFGQNGDRWEALKHYYGSNLCRLVEIKRVYDPDLFLDFPQGIPLDAPVGECPEFSTR